MSARKRYTPEFRRDAASLVIERGETIAQVARDLNVGGEPAWPLGETRAGTPGGGK